MTGPDAAAADGKPGDGLKLLLGSRVAAEGWTVVDVRSGPDVDIVADIRDLSALADGSCAEIYASHVLEHVSYVRDLGTTLRGIYRLLKPGGRFRVSVPDMDVLCAMMISEALSPTDKFNVMRIMFGGQVNEYDLHRVGFNFLILSAYLEAAGFTGICRVREFGLFQDTSALTLAEIPISLNVEAWRPPD